MATGSFAGLSQSLVPLPPTCGVAARALAYTALQAPIVGSQYVYALADEGLFAYTLADISPVQKLPLQLGCVPLSGVVEASGLGLVVVVLSCSFGTQLMMTNSSTLTTTLNPLSSSTSTVGTVLDAGGAGLLLGSYDTIAFGMGLDGAIIWNFTAPSAVVGMTISDNNGNPVVVLETNATLLAVFLISGQQAWAVPTAPSNLMVANETILFLAAGGPVMAVSPSTGKPLWQSPGATCTSHLALTAACTIVCAQGGLLVSLNPQTGVVGWSSPLPSGSSAVDVIVGPASAAVLSASTSATVQVSVVSLSTGSPMWSTTLPGSGGRLAMSAPGTMLVLLYNQAASYLYQLSGWSSVC